MFLSLHTMLHSYVHVTWQRGVGWGGVGWGCERSFEVEHATDATLSMGWGGDVNVRLKLNTPLMLR